MMDHHVKLRQRGARRRNRKPLNLKRMWVRNRRPDVDQLREIVTDAVKETFPIGKPLMLAPFRQIEAFRETHPKEAGEHGVPTDRDYDEER